MLADREPEKLGAENRVPTTQVRKLAAIAGAIVVVAGVGLTLNSRVLEGALLPILVVTVVVLGAVGLSIWLIESES